MSTFPKVVAPVAPSEVLVAAASLDAGAGRTAVDRAIRDGFLRPFDIDRAEVDPPVLLYVPFWRVEASVVGFHFTLSLVTSGPRTIPVPTGGTRHKDAVVMICARSTFPYEPKLPSVFGRLGGAPPLEVGKDELVGPAQAFEALRAGEVLDADVRQADAERHASGLLLRAVDPRHALYAKYEPRVRAAAFCLYPMYYARYRYEGEARRHPGEELFVAVSGRTGHVVSARHPSAVRSVAAKVRRLLSFDRR